MSNLCMIDNKTVFRRNLANIARECNTEIDNLSASVVKNSMEYALVPDDETWRVELLHNLLALRNHEWTLENFENNEIDHMIWDICTT